MKTSISIIDDNSNDIKKIKNALCSYFPLGDITFHIYENPLSIEYDYEDDLYILDIDMPNKDGYHVAKDIYNKFPSAKIIFCTMHDDFVFTSFQFNPFYFVRKNHLDEDFKYAIEKYNNSIQNKYYIYSIGHINKKIYLSAVMYIESIHNDLYFHTSNEIFKIRSSIKEALPQLNDSFIRISNGVIVNSMHINTINNNEVLLNNSTKLIISRSLLKDVILKYNKFIMES